MAFPLDKCWENMPEVPHEDLHQLNVLTFTLYNHKHWIAKQYFYKNLYKTQLKQLTGEVYFASHFHILTYEGLLS
uniref:Uncharacterized protein n=1 Tax=Trichobilharzia regenti TaxID=157069 RepID=A0AA85J389_TRIRE